VARQKLQLAICWGDDSFAIDPAQIIPQILALLTCQQSERPNLQ
jgi:hypothetical protein